MDEVAFTAYYPADISSASKQGLDWLLRPAHVSLHGFSIFAAIPKWILWPVVYLFGIFIKIPVYTNAPLLRPDKMAKPIVDQWPLVIFSHGLGGSRTAYSHLCSRLAASGKVVLAIEHRDGTGHACISRSWGDSDKKNQREIYYLKENQIEWENHPTNVDPLHFPLRADQLELRRQEIYTTYSKFCSFLKGEPSAELETIDGGEIDKSSWSAIDDSTQSCPVKVHEDITLAGHSFGGCTTLSILSTKPPPGHESIPISQTLILDPWLEPLPIPGPIPRSTLNSCKLVDEATIAIRSSLDATTVGEDASSGSGKPGLDLPRMLVINSETFTLWEDHFIRLREVVQAWEPEGDRIITLVGSQHTSFSDFPILPLVQRKEARLLLDTIVHVSLAFLDSSLELKLDVLPKRSMETRIIGFKPNGKPKRKLVGNAGDIIVHV
ncbi:hypothetical protein AX17_000978 [Amanita inopinata Kibby_2008]|nr:hypothetical protein AX17_000978 [Amanita inopinata Kibby_2008]